MTSVDFNVQVYGKGTSDECYCTDKVRVMNYCTDKY